MSEHYIYSCNLSLQFRNTSFDKLAFDRRERFWCIIRPALLDMLTAKTDLFNFIIVTCKIWWKIGLGHETSMAETETETRPRR